MQAHLLSYIRARILTSSATSVCLSSLLAVAINKMHIRVGMVNVGDAGADSPVLWVDSPGVCRCTIADDSNKLFSYNIHEHVSMVAQDSWIHDIDNIIHQ